MLKYIRKLLMGNSDKKEANRKAEIGVHFNESKGFIVVSYAIAKGRGHIITDDLRKMWQAEIDKYGNMQQEEVTFL